MLKKRIIPTLLLSKGRMVKGRNFSDFRDTGDPVSSARIYNSQNADELIFLDIDANRGGSQFSTLLATIERVSEECFMPLTVGGGIDTINKIKQLLRAGADKVVITTAAFKQPELIEKASDLFGKQCIIVGTDIKKIGSTYVAHSSCGSQIEKISVEKFIDEMTKRGAGEFFINSIDNDGCMNGFDLDLIRLVKGQCSRPLIAAGGSGTFAHLVEAFAATDVDALACSSIFHFGDNNPIRARSYLLNNKIPMKLTK